MSTVPCVGMLYEHCHTAFVQIFMNFMYMVRQTAPLSGVNHPLLAPFANHRLVGQVDANAHPTQLVQLKITVANDQSQAVIVKSLQEQD
jgi:hypothetical protein